MQAWPQAFERRLLNRSGLHSALVFAGSFIIAGSIAWSSGATGSPRAASRSCCVTSLAKHQGLRFDQSMLAAEQPYVVVHEVIERFITSELPAD